MSRIAEAKLRGRLGAKVSSVQAWMSSTWPEVYKLPKEAYLGYLRSIVSELPDVTAAIEKEIERLELSDPA